MPRAALLRSIAFIGLIGFITVAAHAEEPANVEPFFQQVRKPFWTNPTQIEPLFFIQESPDKRPQARLLYPIAKVVRVQSADRTMQFEANRDYTVGDDRIISLPEGSRILFKTTEQLYPLLSTKDHVIRGKRGDETRGILFGEGAFYHGMQVEVTYEAMDTDWGPAIVSASPVGSLPRFTARFKAKQPVHILAVGDSISAGGNASKMTKAAPGCPAFPELVAGSLQRATGSEVKLTNVAVGGWTSDHGLKQAQDDRPAKAKPDLVMIAFGMNDVGRRDAARYKKNIEGIISEVRKDAPEAEFLLVATMLSNSEWFLPMDQFPLYRDALVELKGPGIAVADLTSMWTELLKRKTFYDLTGNGVNHPNDYGHLVYGQVIFSTLNPR